MKYVLMIIAVFITSIYLGAEGILARNITLKMLGIPIMLIGVIWVYQSNRSDDGSA